MRLITGLKLFLLVLGKLTRGRKAAIPVIFAPARGIDIGTLFHDITALRPLKKGLAVVGGYERTVGSEDVEGQGLCLQRMNGLLSDSQPLLALPSGEIEDSFRDRLRDSAILFFGFSTKDVTQALEVVRISHRYSLIDYWQYMKYLPQPSRPPYQIPEDLHDRYTMNARLRVIKLYRDHTCATKDFKTYRGDIIDSFIERVRRKEIGKYKQTDTWLYQALEKHSIRDKQVVIMGSTSPWYESICLAYEGKCTTVEYNRIVSEDPSVRTLTPDEYDKDPVPFEAAISVSSFEHDGLGRYGDPIDPDGDLRAMKKMKSMLKPGGVLFLAVPLGRDTLVWNVHRVYGRERLPLLLAGWKVLDTFGYEEELLDRDRGKDADYQPIFVLKNHGS